VLAVAVTTTFLYSSPALAAESGEGSLAVLADAVESAGQPASEANSTVDLPRSGRDSLELVAGSKPIGLAFPAKGPALERSEHAVLFDGNHTDTQIAVETTPLGARALVMIDSEAAPERYAFPLDGAAAMLKPNRDGSVEVLDASGKAIGYVAPAWAVDAEGRKVPTHYDVSGTTLIQVVEHRGKGFSYGIVADPSIWQILKCTAAITVAVGSTIFAAAKIAKIKKIIKAAGGVKKAARRVIKAFNTKGSLSKKAKAGFGDLGSAVVAAAIVVLDIDTIQANCS